MAEGRTPRLSVCVPSRNRQDELIVTLESLLSDPRPDLEIVVADNSDDRERMIDYIAARRPDPRLVFLPSDVRVHSMRDNWERAYRATTGDFIAVIGDDDYIDPAVIDFIDRVVARDPEIDAIAWQRLAYNWPAARTRISGSWVSLVNEVHKMPKSVMVRRMFRWEGAAHVPACPFTIYHGAVSRPLMEKVRTFSGRYFEHPMVDYDNSFKLLFLATGLAYADRPFSVTGISPKSNSAAIGRPEKAAEANKAFVAETGHDFGDDDLLEGFAFGTRMSVASAILAAQTWFKRKYGITLDGWEENFAAACMTECAQADTQEAFAALSASLRAAFEAHEGGRFASLFKPVWRDPRGQEPFFGLIGRQLMLNEAIGESADPKAFYDIVSDILPPPDAIVFRF